jgi:hypothetical protein
MMASSDRGNLLPQRGEQVLAPPARCIGGVDRDHRQAGVGSRLGQPVPEPRGGETRDQPPEAPSAPPGRRPTADVLASLLTGISKIQVLDHHRPAAALAGEPDQGADGRANPPVALEAGSPARTSGMVTGGPAGFPSGVTTHAAR